MSIYIQVFFKNSYSKYYSKYYFLKESIFKVKIYIKVFFKNSYSSLKVSRYTKVFFEESSVSEIGFIICMLGYLPSVFSGVLEIDILLKEKWGKG